MQVAYILLELIRLYLLLLMDSTMNQGQRIFFVEKQEPPVVICPRNE